MKIAIIGIGGVGGVIGSLLVKAGLDVTFIARGYHLEKIRKNGLSFKSDRNGNFIAVPNLATDNPNIAGIMDVIFVCVKGYGINDAAKLISPMVGDNTIIIPLLNGVGIGEKIQDIIKKGTVIEGCVYITSLLSAPGEVTQIGNICRVVFGPRKGQNVDNLRLKEIEETLIKSNIMAVNSNDIECATWEKYIFLCAYAACSSFYKATAIDIQSSSEKLKLLKTLMEEVCNVGLAKGVALPKDIVEKNMKFALTLHGDVKSSLQRDLEIDGKMNEGDMLIGEVLRLGLKYNVPTPASACVARKLNLI